MSQILKLTHENQQLKRQVSQYKQVLGVSPFTDDSLFKGGYRVVKTIADRDKIDCCHRKQGMKVIVVGEDLSFKEYILKTDNCKENTWEEISVTVEENEVFLIEDYSELSEDLMTQKDLNLVLKQLILNLQTQINNIELIDEKVQITENTNFAQVGQTQKDFNKKVSDYKASSDLKNQEQDDRMSNIEGENVAQNDLINGLQADLDNQIVINANQDERINNLEGINYTWSPTNRTLTLFDREGVQLSQVSLVSLDNEGTDIRYNASTLSLELYNADNEILDSIPVSSFIGSVGTQLQLNSNQLQLKDSQGNILSTVNFEISNINGLQIALNDKLNIPTMTNNYYGLWDNVNKKFINGQLSQNASGNIGIGTTPTHSITLPNSASGIALYSTSDQTTNYSRLVGYWNGNKFLISNQIGGTGTLKDITIESGNAKLNIGTASGFNGLNNSGFVMERSGGNTSILTLTGSHPAGTGSLKIATNTSATGNATLKAIEASIYDTSTTTGEKLLIDLGLNSANYGLGTHSSKYKVDTQGNSIQTGYSKSLSYQFTLQSSITPTPNTLVPKTDGSGLLWYDNNSVLRNIGENFFSADLSNTTARNHTMNAGVTVNTLGNPHTLSGLPNKNTDIANFRKVRVQNASGLDSVVDSKNLLTDGVTSMTDEEKDAWRLAQRKSTETYSTSAPRIDYILPFVIKREDAIQYIMLQGINLYVNPETAIVKIVNISTLQEYDVLTNSITVYANDFNKLQFSFNFSTVPAGSYKIKLVNNSVQNIDNTTFDVVDSINSIPISCSWETVQSSNSVFTTHNAPITTSNSIYQKCATVNDNSELTVASVSKSSALLTQTQANGDWIITLDITHNKNNDYWGGWFVGLMKSSINIDLLNNIDFGYGRSSYIYKLIPLSNINIAITTANTLVEKFIMIKTGLKIALFWVNGSTFTLIGVATLFENINSDLSLVLKTYGSNYQSSNGSYNNSDVQVQISSIISK